MLACIEPNNTAQKTTHHSMHTVLPTASGQCYAIETEAGDAWYKDEKALMNPHPITSCLHLEMLKGLVTSCVFALLAAQANAQVPLTTDTLPNGKKVSYDSFIGRFSVYTEVGGPIGLIGSMNVGYALVKRDGWLLDYNLGISTLPIPGLNGWERKYMLPAGLSLQIGRRRSRLNIKLGYTYSWT